MKKSDNDPEVLFLRLVNSKDVLVAQAGDLSELPSEFSSNPRSGGSSAGYRNIFRSDERGSVQLVVRDNAPSFQGNASHRRAAAIYLSLIPKFKQIEEGKRHSFDATIRRFAHNLSKFQDKFKQPFVRLVPEKARAKPFNELREEVKVQIESDTASAATDVATMSFRATDLDAQIETLSVLGGFVKPPKLLFPVNIKKAMYRLTNPFVQDLSMNRVNIAINIEESGVQNAKANVAHGLFNVSIWQIFDNACKYVIPDSTIEITMDMASNPKRLFVKMISVTIEEDELVSIFAESYRGRHAKLLTSIDGQESSGIGLHIVQKALKYMKAKIRAENRGHVANLNGVSYSAHVFTIEFCG